MTTESSFPHPHNLLFTTASSSTDMADLNLLSKSSPSQLSQFQLKRSRAQPIPLPTATSSTDYPTKSPNHGKLMVTSPPNGKLSNLSHVPCKFFKQGTCTAGANCTFSHNSDLSSEAAVCKYFLKGNCKFGSKCALLHTMSIFHPQHQQQQHQQYQFGGNSKRFLSSSVNSHLHSFANANSTTAQHNGNRRRQQTTSSSLSDQMMLLSISPPWNSPFQAPLAPLPIPTTPSNMIPTATGAAFAGSGAGSGNKPYLFNHNQDPFFGTSAPPSTTMSSSFSQQYKHSSSSHGMWRQHSNSNSIATPPLTAGSGLRHVSAATVSTAEAFGTSPLFISGSLSTSSHPAVAATRFQQYASSSFKSYGRKGSMTMHDYFDDAFDDSLLEEEERSGHFHGSDEEELDHEKEDIHALNDAMLPSSLNHDVFTPKELQLRMHRQRQQSSASTSLNAFSTVSTTAEWSGHTVSPLDNNRNYRVPFYINPKQQQQPLITRIENNDNGSKNAPTAINIPGKFHTGSLHADSSKDSQSSHGSVNNSNNGYLLQQPLRQDELSLFSLQDDEVQFFMEDDTSNNNHDADTLIDKVDDDKNNNQKKKGYDVYHKTSDVTSRSTNNDALFPPLLSLPLAPKKSM